MNSNNVSKPVFEADGKFVTGVLIILGTVILILIFLELMGYIHSSDETNNIKENFISSLARTNQIRPDVIENDEDRRNFERQLLSGELRSLDADKPNKEDYTPPRKVGYYNIEEIIKENNGIKKEIGDINSEILSNVFEIEPEDVDKILNDIKNNNIEFILKNFDENSRLLNIKRQMFDLINLEFISYFNKLFLKNMEQQNINLDQKLFKIVSYKIQNNDFNTNKNDRILENPPVFRPLLDESIPSYLKEEIMKKVDDINSEDISSEVSNKDFNLGTITDYDNQDLNNFSLTNNKVFMDIQREGAYQYFTIYMNYDIESNIKNILDRTATMSQRTQNQSILIKFNTLKVFATRNQLENDKIKGNLSNLEDIHKNNTITNKKWNISNSSDFDIEPNYFKREYQEKEIDDYVRKLSTNYLNSEQARCFVFKNGKSVEVPKYSNKVFCESYHPEHDQYGVWDYPCQVNTDCPFYKANKNYDNEFGGCNVSSGKCEMPLGLKRVGFKKINKDFPICYNCPNTISNDETSESLKIRKNNCCEEQQKKINNNTSRMKSPDYAFPGDITVRNLQNKNLEKNGIFQTTLN